MSGNHRLFRFPKPQWLNSPNTRTAGVYVAGAICSIGFFTFLDAASWSKNRYAGDTHVNFVDWIPGICSALGMLVINLIEKTQLSTENFSSSSTGAAWQARSVLFFGFALLAGGLAGSVAVMVLKYLVQGSDAILWFGVANIVGNALIMLSTVILWVSQNIEEDYTYNLTL